MVIAVKDAEEGPLPMADAEAAIELGVGDDASPSLADDGDMWE